QAIDQTFSDAPRHRTDNLTFQSLRHWKPSVETHVTSDEIASRGVIRQLALYQPRLREPELRIAVELAVCTLSIPDLFSHERAEDQAVQPICVDAAVRPEAVDRARNEPIAIHAP